VGFILAKAESRKVGKGGKDKSNHPFPFPLPIRIRAKVHQMISVSAMGTLTIKKEWCC